MTPYHVLMTPEEKISYWVENPKEFLVICAVEKKQEYIKFLLTRLAEKKNSDFYMVDELRFFDLLGEDQTDRHQFPSKIQKLFSQEILVFNGMVSSPLNPWRSCVYDSFVDFRYSCMKPTVIFTGLATQSLEKLSNGRLASRMYTDRCIGISEDDVIYPEQADRDCLFLS